MDKYELFRKNHKMTKYEVLEDISDTLEKILKRAETDIELTGVCFAWEKHLGRV